MSLILIFFIFFTCKNCESAQCKRFHENLELCKRSMPFLLHASGATIHHASHERLLHPHPTLQLLYSIQQHRVQSESNSQMEGKVPFSLSPFPLLECNIFIAFAIYSSLNFRENTQKLLNSHFSCQTEIHFTQQQCMNVFGITRAEGSAEQVSYLRIFYFHIHVAINRHKFASSYQSTSAGCEVSE